MLQMKMVIQYFCNTDKAGTANIMSLSSLNSNKTFGTELYLVEYHSF